MKITNKYFFLAVFALVLSFGAFAQPQNPGGPVPFGFVEVLMVAGAALGGKKLYDKKKNEE